jgi:hypothetical protein
LSGFVNPQGYQLADGLELMTQSGSVSMVPYDEVKLVCFVRDFQQGEPRKELRLFTTRPKLEGLWLRMYFRDGDAMDGILSNNLLQLDSSDFRWCRPIRASKTSASSFPERRYRASRCWAWWAVRCDTPRKPN